MLRAVCFTGMISVLTINTTRAQSTTGSNAWFGAQGDTMMYLDTDTNVTYDTCVTMCSTTSTADGIAYCDGNKLFANKLCQILQANDPVKNAREIWCKDTTTGTCSAVLTSSGGQYFPFPPKDCSGNRDCLCEKNTALTAPQHTATVPSPSTTIQTPTLATRTTHIPNSPTKPSGITATTPTETSATTTTTSPAPIRAPSARATFHDFLMPPKFSLPPDTDRLQHVQTNSQVVCAARCLRMTGCRSFTLRPTENACNLYKGDYSGGGADVDPSDTKYFVKH